MIAITIGCNLLAPHWKPEALLAVLLTMPQITLISGELPLAQLLTAIIHSSAAVIAMTMGLVGTRCIPR